MHTKHIEIRSVRLLQGPNIWTVVHVPMLEALIDIGELEDYPSNKIPGLHARLQAWLPGLIEHRCSPGCRGGFLMRLEEGTWPGHILEHISLELQTQVGLPFGYGRTRETSEHGVYKLVFRTPAEGIGHQALLCGRDLLLAAIAQRSYDVAAAVEHIRAECERHHYGQQTSQLIQAADLRRLPFLYLSPNGNLVQFGYGARQRRVWIGQTGNAKQGEIPPESDHGPSWKTVLDRLFPPENTGQSLRARIPLVGVSGSLGKTIVARLCARILSACGLQTGLASSQGLFVGKQCVDPEPADAFQATRSLLLNPRLEAAVVETSDMQILSIGMAYDLCAVGIVTNLAYNPATAAFDMHDTDDAFRVLRTQVDTVLSSGDAVLNAEDEQVADMGRLCDGGVIFFALDPEAPALVEHCAQGKRGITLCDGNIVWQVGQTRSVLFSVADLPADAGNRFEERCRNTMAALGMAMSLNLPLPVVRSALTTPVI